MLIKISQYIVTNDNELLLYFARINILIRTLVILNPLVTIAEYF